MEEPHWLVECLQPTDVWVVMGLGASSWSLRAERLSKDMPKNV